MAEPSWGQKISRRSWLLAGLTTPLFAARAADALNVTFDGDNLHVAVPDLHFLDGKPLERMKDGSTVVFQTNLTLYRDQFLTQWKHTEAKFAISYDIWGEGDRFAVAKQDTPTRRADNLSKVATEVWCLEQTWIAVAGVAPDRPFWLQLDIRVGRQRNLAGVLGENSLSWDLIELATSKPGIEVPTIRRVGPLKLSELLNARPGRRA